MAQLSDYLALIAREHQPAPNFLAFISIFLQGQVDNQNILAGLAGGFDLDMAVGQQLDFVGVRVGQSRNLATLTLDDADYRFLLRGVIAANHWDGTALGAYNVWTIAFGAAQILLQDNQDMSILIVFLGALTAETLALLTSGNLALKPAAVRIAGYFQPSVPGAPVFGFGVQNGSIAGWGTGVWAEKIG